MDVFAELPFPLTFLLSLALIVAANEIGRFIGARTARVRKSDVSILATATLGLLGLLIAFTFSIVLAGFDARRTAMVEEANAIGTTALRGRLLPSPQNAEVLDQLRRYVQIRVNLLDRNNSREEYRDAIDTSNAIQESLWRHAKALAAKDNAMVPTGLFIQSLNEMIDDQQKLIAATSRHLPSIVLISLYATAMVATAFLGFGDAQKEHPSRRPTYWLAAILAALILVIQDIDQNDRGVVTLDPRPMIDTAETLAGFKD